MARFSNRGSALQRGSVIGSKQLSPQLLQSALSANRLSGNTNYASGANIFSGGSDILDSGVTDTGSNTVSSLSSSAPVSSISGKISDALAKLNALKMAKSGATTTNTGASWSPLNTASLAMQGIKTGIGLAGSGGTSVLPVVGQVVAGANMAEMARKRLNPDQMRDVSGSSAGEILERDITAPGISTLLDLGSSALVGKLAGDNPFTRAMGELRNAENQMIAQPVVNTASGVMSGDAEKVIKNLGYILEPGTQYLPEEMQYAFNPARIVHDTTAKVGDKLVPDANSTVQNLVGGAATILNPVLAFTEGGLGSLISGLFGGGDDAPDPVMEPAVRENIRGYQEWISGRPGTKELVGNISPITGKVQLFNEDPNFSMSAYSNYQNELAAQKTAKAALPTTPWGETVDPNWQTEIPGGKLMGLTEFNAWYANPANKTAYDNLMNANQCFMAGTMIAYDSGLMYPVELLELNDRILLGGKIIAIGKALSSNIYEYHGMKVEGNHAVYEDGVWKRVQDSPDAIHLPQLVDVVVYPIVTENHLIVAENRVFADLVETTLGWGVSDERRIEWLNEQSERNIKLSDIQSHLQALRSGERLRNADCDMEAVFVGADS